MFVGREKHAHGRKLARRIPETKASLKQELMVTAFSFAKAPSKGIRHNKAKFRIMMLTG